jgi:hypothetical protein
MKAFVDRNRFWIGIVGVVALIIVVVLLQILVNFDPLWSLLFFAIAGYPCFWLGGWGVGD